MFTGICAHRGDSSRFRENTLPAIESAIDAGAQFVEIDVRVTADGEVVVIHDATLERLWDIPVPVAGMSLAAICEIGDRDHRPPLLSEVLELFGEQTRSTLLIDMDHAAPAAPAQQVVATSGVRVAWCGDLEGMFVIRALDQKAEIWMPWRTSASPILADIRELAPSHINVNGYLVSAELVEDVHSLGCKIAVWTVDEERDMRRAIDLGVDTVTTNQLTRLKRIVADRPGVSVDSGQGG